MSRLVALPTELLYHIAKTTSIHRAFTPRDCAIEFLWQRVDHDALLRLALTCKTLAAVALPLLYRHASSVHHGDHLDTTPSLVHTLCSRPDLAAHVAELTFSCDPLHYRDLEAPGAHSRKSITKYKKEWLMSPDEAAFFNKAFRDHGITDPSGTEEGGNLTPRRIEAVKANTGTSYLTFEEQGALAALAIVKSPNLRRLRLSGDFWALPRTVQSITSLDRLTEVYVVANTNSLYNDFHLDSSFNWLLAAAPALRKLSLNRVEVILDMVPCTLTELVLIEAVLDDASVREMCKSFPALQRLSFVAGYYEIEGGAQCSYLIRHIVETYKNSLCYLRLDWSSAVNDLQRWGTANVSLAGLKSMTRLTELVVATPLLYRDETDDDRGFWASLLAPKLNVLKLEGISGDWLALPLILAVGDNCSQIRSVTVGCEQPPADEAAVRRTPGLKRYQFSYYTIAAGPARSDDNNDNDGTDESGWTDVSDDDEEGEEGEESNDSDGNAESEQHDD